MTFEMRDLAWLLAGANAGMLLARLLDWLLRPTSPTPPVKP